MVLLAAPPLTGRLRGTGQGPCHGVRGGHGRGHAPGLVVVRAALVVRPLAAMLTGAGQGRGRGVTAGPQAGRIHLAGGDPWTDPVRGRRTGSAGGSPHRMGSGGGGSRMVLQGGRRAVRVTGGGLQLAAAPTPAHAALPAPAGAPPTWARSQQLLALGPLLQLEPLLQQLQQQMRQWLATRQRASARCVVSPAHTSALAATALTTGEWVGTACNWCCCSGACFDSCRHASGGWIPQGGEWARGQLFLMLTVSTRPALGPAPGM